MNLEDLVCLKKLDIRNNNFEDPIVPIKQLEVLYSGNCLIDNMNFVTSMTHLIELDLSTNPID